MSIPDQKSSNPNWETGSVVSSEITDLTSRLIQASANQPLPVHFFTIVLNGEPFIRHHIEVFKQLTFPWHWHIVEGVADLKHCTAWSVKKGGHINSRIHQQGRSNDGTSEYLDYLKSTYPENITLYRKAPDVFWDGKIEMINAPLSNIRTECLLWEIDADELWLPEQITAMRRLFQQQPQKTSAYYRCHYFVGPDLIISTRGLYGDYPYEWLRTWRYTSGCRWISHEPPKLVKTTPASPETDLSLNHFTKAETEAIGAVFQHFAYAVESQLSFKEIYYGYYEALSNWQNLQRARSFPVLLENFLSWITDKIEARPARQLQIIPIGRKNLLGAWSFLNKLYPVNQPQEILYVRTDAIGDAVLSAGMLPKIHDRFPGAAITVVCQEHLNDFYQPCPYVHNIIAFNEQLTLFDQFHSAETAAKIQALHPDLTLCPIHSPKIYTHLYALCARAKESWGVKGELANILPEEQQTFEAQYTHLVESVSNGSEIEQHKNFLRALKIDPANYQPAFWITPTDERAIEQLIHALNLSNKKLVAIFCGALKPIRSSEIIGKAIRRIGLENNLHLVALGSAKDLEINEKNCMESGVPYANLSGMLPLRLSAALLKRCQLAVGVETSLGHIAAAFNIPQVILVGGGHFGRFMPWSASTTMVVLPVECYGCSWKCTHKLPVCISSLDPKIIERAVSETWRTRSERPRIYVQTKMAPNELVTNPPGIMEKHLEALGNSVEIIRC